MKTLMISILMICTVILSGCGGSENPPAAVVQEKPQSVEKAVSGPDEEWGKTAVRLAREYGSRGGYLLTNLKKALKAEPEKSRSGLLKVIQKKLPDWDFAFSLLYDISDRDFPGLRETLLKVYRQDGYSGSRDDAIELLARTGYYEIAPEVLAYLKTKKPAFDTRSFEKCASMLKGGKPSGTGEFIISMLEQKPLMTGASLGPMAEVLGVVDPEHSFALLEKCIFHDNWDEKGYIGAVRGMGAIGSPRAKEALLKFVDMVQELLDNKQIVLARKYGTAPVVAYGELAGFDGEDVWECLLLHNFSSIPGMEAEEERVKKALSRVPKEFILGKASEWAYQTWQNDRKYKPKNSESRKLVRGEVLLSEMLDQKFRKFQLEQFHKLKGNSMYDGNVAKHLMALANYARNGDQEIAKLYREFASKKGQERFTSRNFSRQMLVEFKDPYVLECILNDNYFGDMSDWNRLREWKPVIVPGLSDRFLAAEIKGGPGASKISDVVFHFLGAESRKDVLEKIRMEIEKCVANPRNSLMMYWLNGLKHWKGKGADEVIGEVIKVYEKEGIKLSGWESDNVRREKQMMLNLAYHVLSGRGDVEAFKVVYPKKPLLYNCHWDGVPDEFKPFMDKDYGPCTLNWPSLEEVLNRK